MADLQKINLSTPDLTEQNIQRLKELFPDVVTESEKEGRTVHAIDFDALKRDLSASTTVVEGQKERYAFTWPGKAQAKIEARTPIDKTLRPQKDKSVNWDSTGNVYIEGDNLEALKLMQQAYMGKIKMIYIDPPYNTGSDFIYHDDFSESDSDFRKNNADFDDEGNRLTPNLETNGRFHSDWCSMIYPRLLLARDLLTEDGVIYISIDDNEDANLRKICDEIFGETNFLAQVVWERAYAPVNLKKNFSPSHDYVLVYARNASKVSTNGIERTGESDKLYANPDNDPRGFWRSDNLTVGPAIKKNIYPITTPSGRTVYPPNGRSWLYSQDIYQQKVADNRIWFGKDGNATPSVKRFKSELRKSGITPMTVWKYEEVGHSQEATKDLQKLMGGKKYFDYPKPVKLIRRMIQLYTDPDSIVLDFFSGSGTTAQAVMEQNADDGGQRQFILVQLPEQTSEKSVAYQDGYHTVCAIGEERIRRAGQKVKKTIGKDNQQLTLDGQTKDVPDIGFRVFKIDTSNKNPVNQTPAETQQDALFNGVDIFKEGRTSEDILYGILPSFGLPYSSSVQKRNLSDGTEVLVVPDASNQGYQLVAFLDQNRQMKLEEVKEVAAWPEAINNVVFLGSQVVSDAVMDDIEELFRMREPETQRWII